MIYHKLVRDRIPVIIQDQGRYPVTRILDPEEYTLALDAKLNEEVEEFRRDRNAEELADILEVVFALGADLGVSQEELLEIRRKKAAQRGSFHDRIWLISDEGEA